MPGTFESQMISLRSTMKYQFCEVVVPKTSLVTPMTKVLTVVEYAEVLRCSQRSLEDP